MRHVCVRREQGWTYFHRSLATEHFCFLNEIVEGHVRDQPMRPVFILVHQCVKIVELVHTTEVHSMSNGMAFGDLLRNLYL